MSCPREMQIESLQRGLKDSIATVVQCRWLIDSYVLDYYTENHWNRLPSSWRAVLDDLKDLDLLADHILNLDESKDVACTTVLPLSLLALRKCIRKLSVPRSVPQEAAKIQMSPLKYLYKKVKDKKCHEIERMAKFCAETAKKCETNYVVDFGAGLGHLARILAFQHGMRVCCLEQQEKLSEEAKIIDEKAMQLHRHNKLVGEESLIKTPVHLNYKLTSDTDCKELLEKIKAAFAIPSTDETFSFGLVGLHPCGDLAIILTKFYLNCKNVRFLNIVGCCYMKLTTRISTPSFCHPVSNFLKQLHPAGLSYEAREIACHAIETYADRLKTNNYDYLKIHCYRALVERILCNHDPTLRGCGLKSVKQKDGLRFQEYARTVTECFTHFQVTEEEITSPRIKQDLMEWKRVVIFYTLRLFLAPLLETIILQDRMLWILEEDEQSRCVLRATFDPLKSPRNHVMTAERGPLKDSHSLSIN